MRAHRSVDEPVRLTRWIHGCSVRSQNPSTVLSDRHGSSDSKQRETKTHRPPWSSALQATVLVLITRLPGPCQLQVYHCQMAHLVWVWTPSVQDYCTFAEALVGTPKIPCHLHAYGCGTISHFVAAPPPPPTPVTYPFVAVSCYMLRSFVASAWACLTKQPCRKDAKRRFCNKPILRNGRPSLLTQS